MKSTKQLILASAIFDICQERFGLDVRDNSFSKGAVRHQHRLPREVFRTMELWHLGTRSAGMVG